MTSYYQVILVKGDFALVPTLWSNDVRASSPRHALDTAAQRGLAQNGEGIPRGTYVVSAKGDNQVAIFDYEPPTPAPRPPYTITEVTL